MQNKIDCSKSIVINEQSSIKLLLLNIRNWFTYLLSKWYLILIIGIIGAFLGFGYSFLKKFSYTATTSFVLEVSNKRGGLGAYAGIASAMGIDISGAGGDLFDEENILQLYRSRKMITQTLLSEAEFNGKNQLLIEYYIEFKKLKEQWEKHTELKAIQFNKENVYATKRFQLLHDSILGQITKDIDLNCLNVTKRDKKLNIIYVTVVSDNELFAKAFNETLVQKVNEFYLGTKTKRNTENVKILQAKTDSVRSLLSGSINRAAAVADATPNQNPTRLAQRVAPIENARANAEINEEILKTLIQNLELSKISLLKETPLIQVIDGPILPLEKAKFGRMKGIILGGVLGVLIISFILIIKKLMQ